MKEFKILNCPWCGNPDERNVYARLETYVCKACGTSGTVDDDGRFTPPTKAKEVRLPQGGFALEFPSVKAK